MAGVRAPVSKTVVSTWIEALLISVSGSWTKKMTFFSLTSNLLIFRLLGGCWGLCLVREGEKESRCVRDRDFLAENELN